MLLIRGSPSYCGSSVVARPRTTPAVRSCKFMIPYAAIGQDHIADGAHIAVTIHEPHGDSVAEHQLRCELLGLPTERLPLLRAVDAVQSDTLAFALVQHRNGVAISTLTLFPVSSSGDVCVMRTSP